MIEQKAVFLRIKFYGGNSFGASFEDLFFQIRSMPRNFFGHADTDITLFENLEFKNQAKVF